jgi:hypothetical protein
MVARGAGAMPVRIRAQRITAPRSSGPCDVFDERNHEMDQVVLASVLFVGLLFLSFSLDKIADHLKEANLLKHDENRLRRAELDYRGIAVPAAE